MVKDKKPAEKAVVKKTYTGIVVSFFKVKGKSYSVGDTYKTESIDSYKTLIKSKRIK